MSFRKERKFRMTSYDAKALKAQLIGKGMTLLHPNRKISSQYFDTKALTAFETSEEGVLPRFKIRVRWYNDDQTALTLERKVSSVEGRYKTTQDISATRFDRMKRDGVLDRDYGRVIPSVVISYHRSYYEYDGLRITFDTDICYAYSRSVLQTRDFDEVIEIKAPFGVPDNFLESLVPVPSSRFSKYSRSFLQRDQMI